MVARELVGVHIVFLGVAMVLLCGCYGVAMCCYGLGGWLQGCC